MNYNGPIRIRTQYFDSHFVYIWNVVHSQKTTLPVTIISFWNIVYFCLFRNWRRAFSWAWFSYVLLLSCFLLFLLFIDFLDGQLLILRQLHCHVPVPEFSTQWNSIRQKNVGRLCVNHTLTSILTFTLLFFRAKQGVWYKQIQLMKGSDFLIIVSSQHFIGNTFTHTALWELHTDESYLSQKEKAIFCLYQSSFSNWVQQSPT